MVTVGQIDIKFDFIFLCAHKPNIAETEFLHVFQLIIPYADEGKDLSVNIVARFRLGFQKSSELLIHRLSIASKTFFFRKSIDWYGLKLKYGEFLLRKNACPLDQAELQS